MRAGFASSHRPVFVVPGPRTEALQAPQKAIDEVSFVVIGDREYFYAGSSSTG